MGRDHGLDDEKILAVPYHRRSPVFSALEPRVLDYAEALTHTPAEVPESLVKELLEDLDREQLVELTGYIAWENFRARFNRGFQVDEQGCSDGPSCPITRPGAAATEVSA